MAQRSPTAMRAGTRFLAASAASALATLNTYRPLASYGYPTILTYLAGLLPSELPLPTAAAAAAASAWFGRRGAWSTGRGKLGLALTAGSVAGLIGLHHLARADEQVLEEALLEGLGSDYRDRLPAALAPQGDPPYSRRRNPLPQTGRRSPYVVARDIAYGDAGKRNLLDIWSRPQLPVTGRSPVLLQVHGGAWVTGSKELQAVPLLSRLAARGWVCVAINYRLSPRATWPDHIVDVKKAIAWIRANIAEWGGDPDFVAVTGGSAGGHLTAVTALTPNEPTFQPGFEDANTAVQAAVPLYGAYDIVDLEGTGRRDAIDFWERVVIKTRLAHDRANWELACPVLLARSDAPPMFIIHGTVDGLVRVEGARLLVRQLRDRATAPLCYAELPRARHAFDVFETRRTGHTAAAIERFLLTAYADHEARRLGESVAGDLDGGAAIDHNL